MFFLACVSGGAAFAYLLKNIFDALRPHLEGGVMLNTSFPSGHTMLAAILYFALATLVVQIAPQSRRVVLMIHACVMATALTGAVGLSRIYLALHWPSDVLAGFAAGVGWVMICWVIFEWLHIPLVPHRDSARAGEEPLGKGVDVASLRHLR